MPFNVHQGDIVTFTVEFFDSTNNLTVPSTGSLTLVYTDSTSGSTASVTLGLIQNGSFFTTTWSSSVAQRGFANYSVNAPGEAVTPADSGQLRIIS